MPVSLQVVVASRDLERRQDIATILVNLGLDLMCVSSVAQCRELLTKEHVDLIFCHRFLADGDYCDILTVSRLSSSELPTSGRPRNLWRDHCPLRSK